MSSPDKVYGLKMALVKCSDSLTPSFFTQVKDFCLPTETRQADLSTFWNIAASFCSIKAVNNTFITEAVQVRREVHSDPFLSSLWGRGNHRKLQEITVSGQQILWNLTLKPKYVIFKLCFFNGMNDENAAW